MKIENADWDKLKTFYNVVIAGGITAASKKILISQPAISRQISLLEHQLKSKLFDRTGAKGLELTVCGKILFRYVKKMNMCLEETIDQVRKTEEALTNDLRIGANQGLIDTWLMDLIPEFVKENTDIYLSILSCDSELNIDLDGVDALLTPYMEDNVDIHQEHLMSWHRKLYAHPSYIEKFGMPTCVADLSNHHLISFGSESIFLFNNINWHLSLGCPDGETRRPFMNVNNLRSLYEMASAGLGIISFSKESNLLKNSELLTILPEVTGSKIDIFYTYHKKNKNKKMIKIFGNYLKKKILSNI